MVGLNLDFFGSWGLLGNYFGSVGHFFGSVGVSGAQWGLVGLDAWFDNALWTSLGKFFIFVVFVVINCQSKGLFQFMGVQSC